MDRVNADHIAIDLEIEKWRQENANLGISNRAGEAMAYFLIIRLLRLILKELTHLPRGASGD